VHNWEICETESSGVFEIDKCYYKNNLDGTKEKIRFVRYRNTPNGKIHKWTLIIKKSDRFIEWANHYAWDFVLERSEVVDESEFYEFDKTIIKNPKRLFLMIQIMNELKNENSNNRK